MSASSSEGKLAPPKDTRTPRQIINDCLRSISKRGSLEKISIPGTTVTDGVVFYEVVVVANDLIRWTILKRFQEFHDFHDDVEQRVAHTYALPPFPEKQWKISVDHLNQNFILQRQSLLDNYLKRLNSIPRLRNSKIFLDFLRPCPEDEVKRVDPADAVFGRPGGDPLLAAASPDDASWVSSEVTQVSISSAQILKRDHVVYQINVENAHKRKTFAQWTVLRRFVEFYQIDQAIRKSFENTDFDLTRIPSLPPREIKFLVDHLENQFIERRRLMLQVYVRTLIRIPEICERDDFLIFLGCIDQADI